MEMYFICCCTWIMAIVFSNANGTANLTLPTIVNCGDQAVLTCTSTNCNVGDYAFLRNDVTVYARNRSLPGADPVRYSSTVTSACQVLLTITNIQLSDAGAYQCTCDLEEYSAHQTLRYECKAVSSTLTANKMLRLTMDRLYPKPTAIFTSLINHTSQLPGTYTCGSSPTLASHYTCTWNSTASLPDGNYGYNIIVTTNTQPYTVFGSFKIVTPPSPTILNLSTIANDRQVVLGAQDTPLTIQCVSRGGVPAPTLAWYRGNTSTSPVAQSTTSASLQQPDVTYTVTLIHTFTPGRSDNMTPFLCRVFYPGATIDASPDPSPASILLYLDLKPDQPTISQTEEGTRMSTTIAVSVSTTAFITIILCIVVNAIVFRRFPNFIMRILQHTCPGNVPKGNEKKTVMQSQTSKESEKQMVYSTLVAAENPTGGENVEAIPTSESLDQTRIKSVYTSLEATENPTRGENVEDISTYEPLDQTRIKSNYTSLETTENPTRGENVETTPAYESLD